MQVTRLLMAVRVAISKNGTTPLHAKVIAHETETHPKSRGVFVMTTETESPYLTPKETAFFLRLKRRTLDNMRWLGYGPRFRKHGGRILYHRDDVTAWSDARRRKSTSGERD